MTEAFGPEDALIVVDVQNDFCEGGAFDLQGSSAIVKPINAIARQFLQQRQQPRTVAQI